MERWGVGVNGYWGYANIHRDTGPAWADPFWREEWDHGTERWAEDGPPDYLGKKWRTASGEL